MIPDYESTVAENTRLREENESLRTLLRAAHIEVGKLIEENAVFKEANIGLSEQYQIAVSHTEAALRTIPETRVPDKIIARWKHIIIGGSVLLLGIIVLDGATDSCSESPTAVCERLR